MTMTEEQYQQYAAILNDVERLRNASGAMVCIVQIFT